MVHLSSLPAYHVTRTSGSIPCYRTTQPLLWLDYSKQARDQFLRIRLKIAKKCCLYLDIFSCVKINVFRSFFAFRLEMHVRCDNQYRTGADRGNILGQPMLFECMGICVLSPAHESEMRGYLVYYPPPTPPPPTHTFICVLLLRRLAVVSVGGMS